VTKRIKIDDLPDFDAAPYLDGEEAIAAFLTDILDANDAGLLAAALGDVARARGMSEIARSAGITREALYKALRPGSEPRFETVKRVCAALGVRLVVQPVSRSTLAREKSARRARVGGQVVTEESGRPARKPVHSSALSK
jgi:probable addiction module antidote protein